jgi:phosphoribosylformylglycinamidine synthase subunit PurSL
VSVGADPDRIAILDNFCWGNTERPETLGSLVRAAEGCRDVALAYGTPFISGKDSLYNEYTHEGKSLAIPGTLLISAMGQVPDVRKCVTMDLKEAGNTLVLVGETRDELGGSHWAMVRGLDGGNVPRVDTDVAPRIFQAVHRAISRGLVRSCHDLSEGGLAVALAEMAIAGGLGATVVLAGAFVPLTLPASVMLFSESPTRFLLEIRKQDLSHLFFLFEGMTFDLVGHVVEEPRLLVRDIRSTDALIDAPLSALKEAWQAPLRW